MSKITEDQFELLMDRLEKESYFQVLNMLMICLFFFLREINKGSHGIEPTFLKLDSWSPGVGFIPIIILN